MNTPNNRILPVQLYTRPGCHLCDESEAELRRLGRRYPLRLEVLDITADPTLHARYWDMIPVLVVEGQEYPAPLDARTIQGALQTALCA